VEGVGAVSPQVLPGVVVKDGPLLGAHRYDPRGLQKFPRDDRSRRQTFLGTATFLGVF
jgi:hypothetical protein